MKPLLVLVDDANDWSAFYQDKQVIEIQDYLSSATHNKGYVINLCRDFSYQSSGYYGSLLAEARGEQPFPSVKAITELHNFEPGTALSRHFGKTLDRLLKQGNLTISSTEQSGESSSLFLEIYFGTSAEKELGGLARHLFQRFQFPALKVHLQALGKQLWSLENIEILSIDQLSEPQQSRFAEALDGFSRKIWRKKGAKKYKYELAILVNPEEKLPPSNKAALELFVKAAKDVGLDADFITSKDIARIPQYDALFIRETTSVTHATYRCAQVAERNGLVVMDSPTAILTCANKVYLHEMLSRTNVPTPKSCLVVKSRQKSASEIIEQVGLPAILKVPDGAFSIGVEKARNQQELEEKLANMFESSAIVLIQEFVPTDFDWRIGVLNGKAIYACRYFMAKGHWQIYNHGASRAYDQSGLADAFAIEKVPKKVIQTAVKAARCMGDGLFGVDLKQCDERVMVIEVNDNPSIDRGVEDLHYGYQLYQTIMSDFMRRLELAHGR